jgi:hypothetical protein
MGLGEPVRERNLNAKSCRTERAEHGIPVFREHENVQVFGVTFDCGVLEHRVSAADKEWHAYFIEHGE